MKNLIGAKTCVISSLLVVLVTGCTFPGSKSSSSGSSSSASQSASSTPTPTPTPTPTYGMNCTSYNGWDSFGSYPVMFFPSISGSTITSVKMGMYLSDGTGSPVVVGNGNLAGSATLTAYHCVDGSGIGASVGSANIASATMSGNDTQQTFTFGVPITIPTNCAAGQAPVGFKLTWAGYGGYMPWGESNLLTSSCFMPQSSSSTAAVARVRGFTAIVAATP